MYPFIKLAATLIRAKYRPKINLEDKSSIQFRVGIADTDMFVELNNARYLNLMELGRWDYSIRVGFIRMMRQNKWGLAVGGASVRYRRRIPFLAKFTLNTQLVCHDGRWFYFLQEFYRSDNICASGLIKAGVTSKKGLVPATTVAQVFKRPDFGTRIPDWIAAWIEAEGQRPWPNNTATL